MTRRSTAKQIRRRRVSRKKEQYYDEVIRLYFQEGLTGPEICNIIPIHNSNVYRWLDEYDENEMRNDTEDNKGSKSKDVIKGKRVFGTTAPESSHARKHVSDKGPSVGTETLEQKVRRLERELSEARMERDLYNEIINVAEKKFDIQIRKKAGTKQ